MLKKFLTLSLMAVILSVTALANLIPTAPMTRVLADTGFSASIAVENNAVIDATNGLSGSATLTVESDAVYENAIVVTAVFDGNTFLTASITDAALVAGSNEKIITLPTVKTDANDSYGVKFYLWESKATLEPLAQPQTITVTPRVEAPEVWSGPDYVLTDDDKPEYDEATNTYSIANGNELAWFSKNADASANAILTKDIYLNNFFEADGVTFDEDWYESVKKNDWYTIADAETTNNWYDYAIGRTTAYAGTFDGNDKIVYGLYTTKHNDNSLGGLFFNITNGTVKDLTVKGAYVISQRTDSAYNTGRASVIANIVNGGTIEGVEAHGLITAAAGCSANLAGSIAVEVQNGASITSNTSYVNIDLSGGITTYTTGTGNQLGVGGIVGAVKNASPTVVIKGNTNYGDINAPYSQAAGGIIGWVNAQTVLNKTEFTGNTNEGDIVAGAQAGEIIGSRKGVDATTYAGLADYLAQNTANGSATRAQ